MNTGRKLIFHPSQIEAFAWIVGLLILFISNPESENHYSLCLLKNSGYSFCPGCGLGHSISYLVRGEFAKSFHSHPLGIFAVVILIKRVYNIFKLNPLITLK